MYIWYIYIWYIQNQWARIFFVENTISFLMIIFQCSLALSSLIVALSPWTLEATYCHQAALTSCRSLNEYPRSSWTMKARHAGTSSSCSLTGTTQRLTWTPLWTTIINCSNSYTHTERTKMLPCLGTNQNRNLKWTMVASWQTSSRSKPERQSSLSCTTMFMLVIKHLCYPLQTTSPRVAVWRGAAKEISLKSRHVTLTHTIPCNTPL